MFPPSIPRAAARCAPAAIGVWLSLATSLGALNAHAQATPATMAPPTPTPAASEDAPLPFAIADEKRLSDEDLATKSDGVFVTGLPDLSVDPLNGFGLGGVAYINFNGDRDDPFFNYTPYRRRLAISAFATTNLTRELQVEWDEPYILNSKWRLRAAAAYEVNPNQLYFGTTSDTLQSLGDLLPEASPVRGSIGSYDAYSRRLATVRSGGVGEAARVADNLYDYFTKDEKILNVSLERAYFDARVRLVIGVEAAWLDIGHSDGRRVEAVDPATGETVEVRNGRSRLTEDQAAGRVLGAAHSYLTLLQSGIVYDTRDLEPDPSRGVFAEITNELSAPGISTLTFDKVFAQAKVYVPILPSVFSKLIFASRFGAGQTIGAAPFFEYQDQWSTEGSIEALGGFHTLRGYKQARFLGRTIMFANFELRYRFAQTELWGQHLGFSVLSFFDSGGAWDAPRRIGPKNLRCAGGAGLRFAWNLSTIVSVDYAVSEEDQQFFLELDHAF